MTTNPSRYIRWAWLLFPLLAVLFFATPIFRGEVLVPGDILPRLDTIWADQTPAHNPLLSDVLQQFWPWQRLTFASFHLHQLPLWNPYQLAGTPFLANDQSGVFDPIRLVSYGLGFSAENAMLFQAILRLSLLGVFTWLWVRRRGFQRSAALTSGILAMVAVPVIAWVSYPLLAAALWLPLLLYGVEVVGSKPRRGMVIIALGLAAQFFSGNIQISAFSLLALIAYAVFCGTKNTWRRVGLVCLGIGLGTAIATIQLFPTATFISHSAQSDTGRRGYATTSVWSAVAHGRWNGWTSWSAVRLNLAKLAPMVAPNVWGDPARGDYKFIDANPNNNFNELAGSIGLIGLILAGIGAVNYWRERIVRFGVLATAFGVGLIVHAPVFELCNYLPLINQTDTERFRLVLMFWLVLLAAFGARWLLSDGVRRMNRRSMIVTAVVVVTFVGLMSFVSTSGWSMVESVSLMIAACLLAASLWSKIPRPWAASLIAVAAVMTPFLTMFSYNTSVPSASLYPSSPVVSAVQATIGHDGRLVGLTTNRRTPLQPNGGIITDLYDLRGYEVVRLPRTDAFLKLLSADPGSNVRSIDRYSPLLDLASVRVALMSDAHAATLAPDFLRRGWTTSGSINGVTMLQNEQALPRAFTVTTVHEVADQAAAERILAQADYDPHDVIVETGRTTKPVTADVQPAVVKAESNDSVTVDVAMPSAGYLMLTDAYDPGWQASVDGVPTTILPANLAFRAVRVPAGDHVVVFRYRPASVRCGAIVSIVGLAGLLVVLGFSLRRRRIGRIS